MLRVTLLVVLATSVALATARKSPNAENIENIFSNVDSRYSNDVNEDANLDVPDLITKYGYPVEVHTVTTKDDYILEMHRIPHGRDANNVPGNKPVVFVMHGLLSSSADWVIMGPGSGLAYILAEEGYDVWMGNAGGNYYSRRHVKFNPDAILNTDFWTFSWDEIGEFDLPRDTNYRPYILAEEGYDVWMGNARGNYYSRRHVKFYPDAILNTDFWTFSWDEIGEFDLPTMIDRALELTGKQSLHYIGHSQGTTAFFVMGSLRPEYNNKIISMHALAPVAFMANNNNLLLRIIAPFATNIESLASTIGVGEFMPNSVVFTWAGQALCRDQVVFQPICSNILFLVGGWNEDQHNATMLPAIFGHTPAGASVRQFAHYGQGIAGKDFRRYDMGSRRRNRNRYGSSTPPRYDLSKVTTPVFLHYSDSDPLAHVNDVDTLFRQLGRAIGKFRIPLSTFSHLDFMWGIDAKELVYNRVINLIKAMDN